MPANSIFPRVSIIMPTYNRAGYIAETIESIRNQTFSNWELIIADDGSDDNTGEIIEQVKDDRIQFHKWERTGRVSQLKNKAIQKARGELIAFIDSDDLWAATKLEKQVAALSQYPEAAFCLTGGYTFQNKKEPVDHLYKQREGLRSGNIFISLFRSEVAGFTQALLLRKECIKVSGLFDETKFFSDPDFIVGLARHFKAVILFEPLFYRRLHNASDSREHWEKRYNEWAAVIASYRDKNELPLETAREALFKLYINFGEKCLLYKERRKAIHQFIKAWRNKPFSIVPVKKIGKAIFR